MSGCVVAAIPIVAGGAVARTATDDRPGPSVEDATRASEDANLFPSETNSPVADTPSSQTELAGGLAVVPEPAAPSGPAERSPQLEEFVRYSTSRAFAFTEGREILTTAVLERSSALDGKRRSCAPGDEREPAILIDLDPSGETFGSGSPLPSPDAIALSLKVLRAEGVKIAWISGLSAADAFIVRDALAQSGLDPDAEDTLLLMRYPDDRKQTRRHEFAAGTCLIAIAGDARSDFDELYDYLVNPDAALALEPMINNGWFLIANQPVRQAPTETSAEQPETEALQADLPDPEMQGPPESPDNQPEEPDQ